MILEMASGYPYILSILANANGGRMDSDDKKYFFVFSFDEKAEKLESYDGGRLRTMTFLSGKWTFFTKSIEHCSGKLESIDGENDGARQFFQEKSLKPLSTSPKNLKAMDDGKPFKGSCQTTALAKEKKATGGKNNEDMTQEHIRRFRGWRRASRNTARTRHLTVTRVLWATTKPRTTQS